MHTRWRDCKEWKHEGLPLSTTSDSAAKLFDAALTQYAGFYDEQEFGGMASTLSKIVEADSTFVMGRVISNGLSLIGSKSPKRDPVFAQALTDMHRTANIQRQNEQITEREMMHVEAIRLLSRGHNKDACNMWQSILVDYPTDLLAVKFLQDRYLFMGDCKTRMKDAIEYVLPHWRPHHPLYGYLLGLHSFTLVETERFEAAERVARVALDHNPRDSWSTHTVAHVLDLTGRPDEGISFLRDTSADWTQSTAAVCHLNWHDSLFHIDKGEYAEALDIFDRTIEASARRSKSMFNLIDACQLLYRLQLEGVDVARRWEGVHELAVPHQDLHMLPFNEIHLAMACVCDGRSDETKLQNFLESLRESIDGCHGSDDLSIIRTDHKYTRVGLAVCEAIACYECGEYAEATELLLAHEWQLTGLGGSDAQRDVVSQLMIHAAIKSDRPEHNRTARRLLAIRKAKNINSSLTDRLMALTLASHPL